MNEMHCYHILGFILLLSAVTVFAYSPTVRTHPRQRYHHHEPTTSSLKMTSNELNNNQDNLSSRRSMLIQSGLVGASTLLSGGRPAYAKKPPPEPLTKENVDAAFGAIQYELEDPKGGVATMQSYIDKEDFEGLLEFTKTYDLQVRKIKWGRCKSFLTNNAEKEVATLLGNSVTFDLIGINRASRAGQENATQANKYLNELRTDLGKMVDMKSTIRFEGGEQSGFNAYYNEIKGN